MLISIIIIGITQKRRGYKRTDYLFEEEIDGEWRKGRST